MKLRENIKGKKQKSNLGTIGASDDLKDAYEEANLNNSVLKLLIIPYNIGVPVYSLTTELDESKINNENNINNNNKSEIIYLIGKLLQDISINNIEIEPKLMNIIINLMNIVKKNEIMNKKN